jgi:hypothetical protein
MRIAAGDRGLEGVAALVPGAELELGRLPDNGQRGLAKAPAELRDQMRRAEAADLLVVGESKMDRHLERARQHLRQQREAQGDEALHVRGAAAIEPAVALRQGEGIAAPRLAFDRHHVGVAGEHEAARRVGADAGPQVGLRLAVRSRHQVAADAVLRQVIADPLDEVEIAARRDRREGDQPLEDVDRVRHVSLARRSA